MADPAAGLIDIIGPASPAHTGTSLSVFLAWSLVTVVLVGLLAWLIVRLPVWRTRLVLRHLRRVHRARLIGTREAAYRLAAELRRHYRVRRLDALCVPGEAWREWGAVLRRLDRLRYATEGSSTRGSAQAKSSAAQWDRMCEVAARRLGRTRQWAR